MQNDQTHKVPMFERTYHYLGTTRFRKHFNSDENLADYLFYSFVENKPSDLNVAICALQRHLAAL